MIKIGKCSVPGVSQLLRKILFHGKINTGSSKISVSATSGFRKRDYDKDVANKQNRINGLKKNCGQSH